MAGDGGCWIKRQSLSSLNSNEFLLDFASNSRFRGADVDVDLGANSEFREIDAGLDGEAGAGDDPALVVRLQVVHVGAGAMHLFADRVTGAMDEVLAESPILNIGPGGVIDLEAVNDFATRDGGLDTLDGAIAGVAHYFENVLERGGRRWRRNSRSR